MISTCISDGDEAVAPGPRLMLRAMPESVKEHGDVTVAFWPVLALARRACGRCPICTIAPIPGDPTRGYCIIENAEGGFV